MGPLPGVGLLRRPTPGWAAQSRRDREYADREEATWVLASGATQKLEKRLDSE
jgi:hypothetical protein